MGKLILTRGIPASGKTTWAKAWVAEEPDNRRRINRDDLRALFGIAARGTFQQEEYVTKVQRGLVQDALAEGLDVVIDDTNLRAKYAKEWLMLARATGTPVEFQDFPITLEEAVGRDLRRRTVGERWVGAEVIKDFYKRYTSKGEMPLIPVLPEDAQPKFKFEPYKPATVVNEYGETTDCILVDIDGTLAHMDDRRSPYDITKYHLDRYDAVVGSLAMTWANEDTEVRLIVMSGRDEQYRPETEKWLRDNYFEYDALYMRPLGDTRNDAIVKNELFEKYIAGKYNVDFVLDDRDRVVAMWRAKGLKVLQVAEGSF